MNRETKIGLITGLAIIVMVGMLLSSYLNHQSSAIKVASLTNLGSKLRQSLIHPISDQAIPMPNVTPPGVQGASASVAGGSAVHSGATPAAYTPATSSTSSTSVVSMPGYNSTPLVSLPTVSSPHLAPATTLTLQNAEQRQSANPSGDTSYTVAANDTLTRIAWHFYHDSGPVAIERIVRANPGKLSSTRSMLRIGERLNIPPAGAQVTMPSMMAVTNSSGSSSPTATSTAGRYTVKAGDTLYQIAIRTMGAATRRNIAAIKTANGISNDRDLRVGEVLKIP